MSESDELDEKGDKGQLSQSEQEEFLWHFSRERQRIHAFIFSLLPISQDAEDVFQQTCMALWKNFHKYDRDRKFYSWACGVAYYAVMNFRRTSKRRRLLFSDELVRELADHRERIEAKSRVHVELLEECVTHLNEKDRKLLTRFYKDGVSAKQCSEVTNLTVQSVYNRLDKIRKRLLECIRRKTQASS